MRYPDTLTLIWLWGHPLLVMRVRSKTLAMQDVPKSICSHATDSLVIRNQMESWPACPWFDNNKEVDGPATKGNVNVCVLDANKAIIKLRTSIWALLSNCTLFFTRSFREGWTFIYLISIMELILPSASEVSQRLAFLSHSRCVIWAELLSLGEGLRGREWWRSGEGTHHLGGGRTPKVFHRHTQQQNSPKHPH